MIRIILIASYIIVVVSAGIGVLRAGLDGDWTEAIAWLLVIFWSSTTHIEERRTDRWATAYLLAAGRYASAYARGYRDGSDGRTFDASRKEPTP